MGDAASPDLARTAKIDISPLNPVDAGRTRFIHELRPAVALADKAEQLTTVVGRYRDVLMEVADKKLDPKVVDSAYSVIRIGALKSRLGETADLEPELDTELKTSSREVFNWLSKNYGGVISSLAANLPDDPAVQQQFVELVGANLSYFIALRKSLSVGKYRNALDRNRRQATMSTITEDQLRGVTDFLVNNSRNGELQVLSGKIPDESPLLTDNLEALAESSRMDVDVLRLDETARIFELQDWMIATGQEARRGRKIYLTPHYRKLIKELHFQTERKNGLGGVILFGEPGTGKTEVLREKNRQQGFDTRVINIHHYTSFNDLIADKAIQLGLDRGASVAQKLDIVCRNFAEHDPGEFKEAFTSMFDQLKKEGKLGENETIADFLKSYIDTSLESSANKDEYTSDDWQSFRDSFITRQRARILRTSLSDSQQESPDDIVKGEILLAIDRKERVVLDEIDKAGPGSLSGILSVLAQSPGEEFKYGGKSVKLPYWFTVDATTNSLNLEGYLLERFVPRKVEMPPVLDQLMIAGVRVSDTGGNILLSPTEQHQLVWFYTYIVPEMNAVLTQYNGSYRQGRDDEQVALLSNRRIQEFTSYLVNFGSKRRTNNSFSEAVHKFFLENPVWSSDPKLKDPLSKLLGQYQGMIEDSPVILSDDQPIPPAFDKKAQGEAALQRAVSSPLFRAISVYETGSEKPQFHPRVISLNDSQRDAIRDSLPTKKKIRDSGVVLDLPTGLQLFENSETGEIALRFLPEGADMKDVATDKLDKVGQLVVASVDGRTVLVSSPSNDGQGIFMKNIFRSGVSTTTKLGPEAWSKSAEFAISAKADRIAVRLPDQNRVYVFYGRNLEQPILNQEGVKRFELASDGRHLLVELSSGQSKLIPTFGSRSQAILPDLGGNWEFAGDSLVVCKGVDIASKAVYLG